MTNKKITKMRKSNRTFTDDSVINFYNHIYKTNDTIIFRNLKVQAEELPIRCQQYLNNDNYSNNMPCSRDLREIYILSVHIWSSDIYKLKTNYPRFAVEDYLNEFYFVMIRYIKSFNRDKGCWVSRCKWISFYVISRWILDNKSQDKKTLQFKAWLENEVMELKILHPEYFTEDNELLM